MNTEPFVMKDVSRALQWVNVCAASCGFDNEKTATVLATLCGFGSWDVMTYAIDNLPPSTCDEHLPSDALEARLRRYATILIQEYEVSPPAALGIIHHISPSTEKPLRNFVVFDVGEDDEDDEDFLGEDDLSSAVITALGTELCPDRVTQTVPLTVCVNSATWQYAMEYLGWEAEELDDEALIGEASLLIHSNQDSSVVPVYLSTVLPPPDFSGAFSEYPSHRLLQYACLGNFMSEWAPADAECFIILSRWPLMTTFRSKTYCCIGVAFDLKTGRWLDLLINRKCRDITTALDLNRKVSSLRKGAAPLGEPDGRFCKQLALRLGDFGPEYEAMRFVGIPHGDEWQVLGVIDDVDFDDDHLGPYELDDFDQFPPETQMNL
ncbi:TPA: hypothetical protein L5U90_003432 [Pseudomonas aeruginosa]|nr:hypothetical protein [Pseudomonas aeruginosa]